jgi:hypothetical protein
MIQQYTDIYLITINCFGCYYLRQCHDFLVANKTIICRIELIDDFLSKMEKKYGLVIDEKEI